MITYSVIVNGKQTAFLSKDQILKAILSNKIKALDLIISSDNSTPRVASSFEEFESGFLELNSNNELDQAFSDDNKEQTNIKVDKNSQDFNKFISNKLTAGLLGILLGGLGIHKFVLGLNTSGIIMLVLTVTSIFAWCLIVPLAIPPIVALIGFIEGVLYLTASDEDFYKKYAVNKQQWF